MEVKTLVKWSALALVVTGCTVTVDPATFEGFLSDTMSHQVSQFTIAFTLAAWIHSGRVKKEIKNQFTALITSFDGVAQALRQDLQFQANELKEVKTEFQNLTVRVQSLEANKGEKE